MAKVDFRELQAEYEKLRDRKGTKRIELSQCPSYCERIAEQNKCTFDNCIEIQKILDYDDEQTLKAYEKLTAISVSVEKKIDKGLKGHPYQRSRKFLKSEIYEPKIRDGVRIYKFQKFDADEKEVMPTCRVSIYGRRGKTETVIVMVETHKKLLPHIHRHGKPLNVPMPNGKRRICLRDCKDCVANRKTIAKECRELELKENCEGCISRQKANSEVSKWFDAVYLPAIGVDRQYLPYSSIRIVARPMTKSKGEKWI